MIQANINDRYAQLSQQEKAELIGIYTRAGYRDLASIIAHYNSYKDGGDIFQKVGNYIHNRNQKKKEEEQKSSSKGIVRSARELFKSVTDKKSQTNNEERAKVMRDAISLVEKMPEPMKKRAIEAGMRISSSGSPFHALYDYARYYDSKPVKDALYIATGLGSPSINEYNGLYDIRELPEEYKNDIRPDIIDAVVHGKKVNPQIGIQVDAKDGDYGVETDYIRRTFPNRTDIQYIETRPPINLINQEGIESMGIIPASFSGSFRTSIPNVYINNQGFVGEYGTRNDSTFVRGFDVYDFASNPGDESGYREKWLVAPDETKNPSNTLMDILEENTSPLVIRTPWVPVENIRDIVDSIDMNTENKDYHSLPGIVGTIHKITNTSPIDNFFGYSCGGKLHANGGPVTNTAQYKDNSYLYNPPVNVGAPIEVPLRYKPLPDYGDYVPQRTTGMLEDIPIEMGLEIPQRGYGVLMPDVPSDTPALDARQDAARRIMAVENSKNNVNGGYDAKTGRWYPHKSHEGGADTIAYGIKLSNGTPEAALALKQGYLTDEQAVSAVDTLVQKYYNDAKKVYDKRFGEGEWDKLSDKSQSILIDYSYNPGLSKFTKLMDAFHSGDKDGILKEYKRYSGKKELGRNKTLFEEIQTLGNEYPIFRAEGGKIHIKPENRGKFTALKKRTGHSASWFKAHGTPAQKKMAVFALNAKKWKHGDGGSLANYLDSGGPYSVIPLGGDYLTYLQTMPEVSGGMIEPSVVTAALPAKFNGSQAAAARYAEGYQKGAKPVSEAMNRAGKDIFKAVDTVVGLTPTPAGAISWLGHMGADAAEGEWGKVGRDVVLAAALGAGARGIGWLKNYVDDATNFGEDIFRAFTDSVPGRVRTNFTYAAPAARATVETVPAVTKVASAPYEIENLGGGYMLKSLMRGNKLESRLSKDGLIKTDVIRGYANQSGGVQKAVMDKILASNEFAGKKSIDYNKFRKAIQDELITYERTPDTRYNDYGVSSLGLKQSEDLSHLRNIEDFARSDRFEVVSTDTIGQARLWLDKTTGDILNWDGVTQRYLSEHDVLTAGPGLNTFIFSSPRIPQGSNRHYDPNTLGHSRTYTTSGEPDVLHVMESQSDWAQQGVALDRSKKIAKAEERYPGGFEARRDKAIGDAKKDVETWKRIIETGVAGDGRKLEAWEIENIRTDLLYNAERRLRELEATYSYVDPQELYLSDNFAPRQIQENLRYAAERGQKKMRYPTRDTAAKIEGYGEGTMYFDANGNDVTKTGQSVTALPEEWQKKYDDIENKIRALTEKDEEYGSIAFKRNENDKTTWITQKTYGDVIDLSTQQREILENHSELRPGITRKKIWTANGDQKTAEMILQKYDAFPKQYKKLYKNADVRTVTDPKGNTWYEVDVPEGYLQQEWAYKHGGLLRKFDNISDIF